MIQQQRIAPGEAVRASPAKPNIVFILADDLGWADTTLYGHTKFYKTPNIERLAKRGVTFTRAYSASPLCSPMRSAVLTGLSPTRDTRLGRCGQNVWPLLTGVVTKPEPRTIYIPHPSGAIVLRDGWKLIARKETKKGGGSVELFNVNDDPSENKDFAQAEPQRVKKLQELLTSLQAGDLKQMPKDAGDGMLDKTDK